MTSTPITSRAETRRATSHRCRNHHAGRRAFSLIEAALVMFLMGLLSLTAAAALGGQQTQSDDRIAQADLDAALDATFGVMVTDGMVTADPARLAAEAPGLSWLAADEAPSDRAQVSVVAVSEDDSVGLAARAKDGACWYVLVRFSAVSGTSPRVFAVAPQGSLRPCTARHALELSAYVADAAGTGPGSSWRNPVPLGVESTDE